MNRERCPGSACFADREDIGFPWDAQCPVCGERIILMGSDARYSSDAGYGRFFVHERIVDE